MKNRERGFTLIELLVVIAIIGILSSVVLASLNSARQKGRDARRISDLKQLQLALELYYDANSSSYPNSASAATVQVALTALTAQGFISTLPDDPTSTQDYHYMSNAASNSSLYCLGANLEGTPPASSCNIVAFAVSGVDYEVGP